MRDITGHHLQKYSTKMKGPAFVTLIAVVLMCHDVTGAQNVVPFVEYIDGGISVDFAGVHAIASLGKFITGNSRDRGLLFKVSSRMGPRAMAVLDGGNDNGTLFGHVLVGAESGFGQGAAAGFGGMDGDEMKVGLFAVSRNGIGRPVVHKYGKYADHLIDLSGGFLDVLYNIH